MEKKRLGLIFIGLCLALIFSMSSVEAQDIDPCDRDGDSYVKNTKKCLDREGEFLGIDCNDNKGEFTDDCGGSGGGEAKVKICHKQPNPKHCINVDGDIVGGAVRLVQASQVEQHLANHLEGGGDCLAFDTNACANHCVCLDDLPIP